jgi:16S rRNA (guanine527-N7)-methyltransferase
VPPREPAGLSEQLAADQAAALAMVDVSRETFSRLKALEALILNWANYQNLIASSTVPLLWTRHIADSLQLLPLAPNATAWVDLGSGGGFPGLVLGCALAGQADARIDLIESNAKKSAFLREAIRVLRIPGVVHNARIEYIAESWEQSIDVVTARALAPLAKLLEYAHPFLEKGAQALFQKGQDVDAELTEAAKYWNVDADILPSLTHPDGRILRIRKAVRR